MPLLNYTTTIAPEKTVSEIQSKLAKAGAFQVLHEYERGSGELVGLSFRITTQFGDLAFAHHDQGGAQRTEVGGRLVGMGARQDLE